MNPCVRAIIFTELLLFCCLVLAQKKGYDAGYIITLEGDTISGLVKDRDPEPFVAIYEQIRFKQEGKRKKKLGPNEINGYKVNGSIFQSVAFTETQDMWRIRYVIGEDSPCQFLKLIRNSEHLILYHQEFIHDDNDYVDFFPLLYRPGSDQLVRATQGIFGVKRKLLSEYFSDCPMLVEEIYDRNTTLHDEHDVFDFYLEHCIWE